VKELYYKRVRGHCAPEIKGELGYIIPRQLLTRHLFFFFPLKANQTSLNPAFAECAVNRTVTATWVCRQQRLAMNTCMVEHAKPEEQDRAREEWFAGREARRRQREEELAAVEKRRLEVIRMMREDEERRKREMK
jgi:COX assembly protein 1